MNSWLFVEVGGSSTQTSECDATGRFWFTPGVVRDPQRRVALACPGIIRDPHVLYATNLGWPDVADPGHELGLDRLSLLVNDAEAAALGESILRSNGAPTVDLVYLTLGTALGIARVVDRLANDPDLAHVRVAGDTYCTGCRNVGCLNSLVCSWNLPSPLTDEDQIFVAQTLASALREADIEDGTLVVVGGGMARRYPAILSVLDRLLPNPIEATAAPSEAKSAAYAGLAYLATRQAG